MDNTSGITPTGYRVLIKPRQIPEFSPGGIAYPVAERRKYQRAEQIGVIIELGPEAYIDKDEPWVEPGDRVFFSRYEGDILTGERTASITGWSMILRYSHMLPRLCR